MTSYVALLRAIGPVTHAVMPMPALRAAAEIAGLLQVSTYIATGNLLFRSAEPRAELQRLLRQVVESFGLGNAVFLRTADEVAEVVAANPFPDAAADHPSELAVCFLSPDARLDWIADHPGPERLAVAGGELCVDYPGQISKSKLLPAVIERRCGASLTARNWNTVATLATRLAALDRSD